MSMTHSQFRRAMSSLRPGDVITNFNCGGSDCKDHKVLVLARSGDLAYEFSVRSKDINIVRDKKGPWHWHEDRSCFINERGDVYDHINRDVEVLEAAGTLQLQWYRELPSADQARFRIDPNDVLGPFADPGLEAKLRAITSRASSNHEYARALQQAVDLIFGGASQAVDERRMRYLVSLVNIAARSQGIDVAIIPLSGDVRDLSAGIPPEIAVLVQHMMGRRQGGTRAGREAGPAAHHPGNGHDASAGAQPHAGQGHGSPGAGSRDHG